MILTLPVVFRKRKPCVYVLRLPFAHHSRPLFALVIGIDEVREVDHLGYARIHKFILVSQQTQTQRLRQ
jgi:hypothetical protein